MLNIDLIQPSPNPIRKTWDDDKMDELAQSIKEQGLIVPVKVRPTDNAHYEVVYGHRRVEACRRAGLDKVEAIIEGMDDTDTLIQALIENVQREDMNPIDKGKALVRLQEQTDNKVLVLTETNENKKTYSNNVIDIQFMLSGGVVVPMRPVASICKTHIEFLTIRVPACTKPVVLLLKITTSPLFIKLTLKPSMIVIFLSPHCYVGPTSDRRIF